MQLIKMIDEDEKMYSEETLRHFSYRSLQQLAKTMLLPSNVKKICLIELIRAKKYCSNSELEDLIKKIKANRKKSFKAKKDNLTEYFEKTKSQNKSPSPKKTSTPKHKSLKQCIRQQTNNEHNSQAQTSLKPNKTLPSIISNNGSDRILRSFHSKKLNKINCNNDDSASAKIENTLSKKVKHKEMVKSKKSVIKINMNSKSLLKRSRPNIVVPKDLYLPNPIKKRADYPVNIKKPIAPPVKTRTLKWIYPFGTDVPSSKSNIFIKNLSVRQSNGTISKLQALIQTHDNIEIEEIGDSDPGVSTEPVMEIFLPNDEHNYINGNPLYDKEQKKNIKEVTNEEPKVYEYFDTDSLYYNDMYGELACCKELATSEYEGTCRLPKIDEAFKTFKRNDYTQPLYVETSDDWRKSYNTRTNNPEAGNLDNLYYSDSQCGMNEPLLKLATGPDLSSYSTSVLSPVMVDRTSDLDVDQYIIHNDTKLLNDCKGGEQSEDIISELNKFSQIVDAYSSQYEDHYTNMFSLDTSQDSATNMTIHDMVDDAIEIIRKDGGYLDDIGNVIVVQCIFCSWAGPQNVLESHVRNMHLNNINKSKNKEWIIKFNLGYLLQSQLWLSEVVEYGSVLYVICVKYEDPDCLKATIATLSSESLKEVKGKIVIYDTVIGEPYTWKGPIQSLSPNMPHFNDLDGLNIQLSTLNLIPDITKEKRVNIDLVTFSPNKEIGDQAQFNSIHIELYMSII